MHTLSFGQTAAVYAFLRVSRALAAIALKVFCIGSVEYFDDFSKLEPRATTTSAMETFEGMLSLLGWDIAMAEDKRFPFKQSFCSLGAQVNLTRGAVGKLIVENKPGIVEAIEQLAVEALSKGSPVH